jgi:hypothetical protein
MSNYPETIQIWEQPFAELNCIKNILLIHLGRQSDENDLKLLTKRMYNKNQFTLFYKKKLLGTIDLIYELNKPDPIKVSFTPFSILN